MTDDGILKVEIDQEGRLCIQPEIEDFALIYRAAMEVGWDEERRCLFSPKPREWTYAKWFNQIVAAAIAEYGVRLRLTHRTSWTNVPDDVRTEIASNAVWDTGERRSPPH